MSRHANAQQPQFALPGARPWLRSSATAHPLAGFAGGAAAAGAVAPVPAPVASSILPEPSNRAAAGFIARPAAIPLPRFGALQPQLSVPRTHPQPQAVPRQAHPAAPAMRYSQLPASQPQGGPYAPWSQRSQMDNIQLTQAEDEQAYMAEAEHMGEAVHDPHRAAAAYDAVVGSAPADTYGCGAPSQAEVSRPPRPAPAQTAHRLLQEISAALNPVEGLPGAQLDGLSNKLDALEGGQEGLATAVGRLSTDLAAQGQVLAAHGGTLGNLGNTLGGLVQVVQSIAGTAGGIEGRLQELLARRAVVTGEMTTQTTPSLAAHGQPATAAAGTQVSPTFLQALNQRRPSSAAGPPPAGAPASAAPRGLAAASPAPSAAAVPPAKPGSQRATAGRPRRQTKQSAARAAAGAAATPSPVPNSTGKGQPGPGSAVAERRRQSKLAPTLPPTQPAGGSRKRPLEAALQPLRPTQPKAVPPPPPSKHTKNAPAAAPSKHLKAAESPAPSKPPSRAELLFDSLFDEEADALAAPPPAALKPAAAAKPAAAVPAPAASPAHSDSDLAAAVQRRLEKHRARFTRRRRSASQRQHEDEE